MPNPLPPHPVYVPERDLPAFFRVKTKGRQLVPFHPNRMQRAYLARKTRRNVLVKARQLGASTVELADNTVRTIMTPGTTMAIIGQDVPLGQKLLQQCKTWLEELRPVGLLPEVGKWNEDQVTFPRIKSEIFLSTAQGRTPGRGRTIDIAHCTEVAHWSDAAGVMAAVSASVPPDGIITVESSPNGAAGWFFEEYEAAKAGESLDGEAESIYEPFFFEWWYADEYRRPVKNPKAFIKTLTSDEKRLLVEHELDLEQIQWRRQEMRQSERTGGLFLQEYPEDDISCFLSAGASVFPAVVINQLRENVRKPIEFEPDSGLRVWKDAVHGKSYVIGADVAEGASRPGSDADYSTAVVIDDRMEHVASLRTNKMPPEVFVDHLAELGRRYNDAYLAVERNGPGHAVNRMLRDDLGYPMLHIERNPDRPGQVDPWRVGVFTSDKNKPDMIARFGEQCRAGEFVTHDDLLLREMGNYVYEDPSGRGYRKAGAPRGAHDDLVMAAMIAVYVFRERPLPVSARPRPVSLMGVPA